MTLGSRATRSTYIGLFFVALATIMYEILLTRIFSVTMLYHFAFVALSLAMFGMTVGALIVYLAPRAFPPERLESRLALTATALPVAMLLSFLTELSIPFRVHPSVVAIYAISLTYVVITVPFVVSGVVVCLVLTGYPARVSRLYAADLAGAAIGCMALIPVINYSDGPTAVLWVGACAACGGIAFAWRLTRRWRALSVLVGLSFLAIAAGHTVLVWNEFPILRILYIKGSFEARPLYEKWNSYSRVRVNGDATALVEPQGWGLSRSLPEDLRVRQLQMDIDVVAGTVMTGFDGDLGQIDHLRYDVTNIAYDIRPAPDVLVIGAGGGRDVLSALRLGARSVVAVEINDDILRVVNQRFGDFTGHLDQDPRVRFVNDEARSFVARSGDRYGLIQISLIDTWAATAAGAFVLSENAIYTVEAWTTFLQHLGSDGILSVSRWYYRDSPAEMYRTLSLAVEALARQGVGDPAGHIAIVRNMHVANREAEVPDGVGTLLVSARPFSDAELETLARVCASMDFELMFTRHESRDPMFAALTSPSAKTVAANYPLRITAPTDDSPFFFNMLRLRDLLRLDLVESGKQSNNLKAVATLGILLGTVTLLTALCIVGPLVAKRQSLRGHSPLLIYFVAIGLGFMLIETSQMQRLIIALGHPTYALSVVLFGLLLSSGLGSYLTATVEVDQLGRQGAYRLGALVAVLIAAGGLTPAIVSASATATTSVRILSALVVLFPIGLMLGMAFPLGMKAAAAGAAPLTPWLWGLNGAASVFGSVLSVCIALAWSISTAFWCGSALYVVALVAFFAVVRREPIGSR